MSIKLDRNLSKYDPEFYAKILSENKQINLFFKNKYITVSSRELLELVRNSDKNCTYCKLFKINCSIYISGVRSFIKHIKNLEKTLKIFLIYIDSEIVRETFVDEIPTINLTINEMNKFKKSIKELSVLGRRYGAVKIVPRI